MEDIEMEAAECHENEEFYSTVEVEEYLWEEETF